MIKKKLIPLFIILVALALFLMPVSAGTTHNACIAEKDGWKCKIVNIAGVDECTKNNDCSDIATAKIYKKLVEKIDISVLGTEYEPYENGTIWLQLLRDYVPVLDATCYATAYNPNKSLLYDNVLMEYLYGSDGIYYYDFSVPDTIGVYMLSAKCFIPQVSWYDDFININKIEMSNNISVVGGKAKLASYNTTNILNYTDGTWENSETIGGLNDIQAVDFDLGNLSYISSNVEICYYASREKTTILANVSVNTTRTNISLLFPQLNQPIAWYCVNASNSLFANGINRIGMVCYKGCTAADNTVMKFDMTQPNGTSYWYENWTGIWHNHTYDGDYAIRVKYMTSGVYTQGNLRSVPITLNGTVWSSFDAEYMFYGGNISFKVLNGANNTICDGIGDIGSCANTTTPIKLYAELNRTGISPELDRWFVSWYSKTVEEMRGVGEFHVARKVCNISVVNQTLEVNLTNQTYNYSYSYTDSFYNTYNYTYNYTQNITLIPANVTVNFTGNFTTLTPKEVWQYFNAVESLGSSPTVSMLGTGMAAAADPNALNGMCLNSTHINFYGLNHVCYGADCFDVEMNRTVLCQYGCDISRNQCKGSPTESWFLAGIIVLIFIIAIVAAWRYLS